MQRNVKTGHAQAGAVIVTREPAARTVTPEVVKHLRDGGATTDLIAYAERHVRPEPKPTK